MYLTRIIEDQTNRALWEVKNIIDCVPNDLWYKKYCDAPIWQHIYHMLHSLDKWYINPADYFEPSIHQEQLNNLDIMPNTHLSRHQINNYYLIIKEKIERYVLALTDEELGAAPKNCAYTRFTLILAQFRHLHTHLGMIMGFIIDDTGMWPAVLGLERPIPVDDNYNKYF